MELEERKKRFVTFLEELLKECGGVKGELAKKLKISPSRLTNWLQGKIDPAGLEILVFDRIAETAFLSTDSLVENLGILEIDQKDKASLNRFRNLVEELLKNQSQEKLGKRLGVSQKTISTWINLEKDIDPAKIPIANMALLAKEKMWTVEKLMAYLGLKKNLNYAEKDLLTQVENLILHLPLSNQIKLQSWISYQIENQLEHLNISILPISNKKILLILEEENIPRTTSYSSNLVHHLQLQPDNIQVTTIPKLPQSLDNIDVLIFDISTADSPSIALIKEISFDGDIVVFASEDLSENLRAGLEDRVTDVLVKPIDWSSLKDKEYFR